MTHRDPVEEALDVVLDAVAQSQRRMSLIGARADEIRRRRAEGRGYAEIVAPDDRPLSSRCSRTPLHCSTTPVDPSGAPKRGRSTLKE